MAITISEISYFKTTAECQNISKAAEILHVSQPALSRSINAFEADLGVELFDHIGRNVVLNHYGEIVYNYSCKILSQIDAMQKDLRDNAGNKEYIVTLDLFAASTFIPGLITSFGKLYPNIRFNIVQGTQDPKTDENVDLKIFSSTVPINTDSTVTLLKEDLLLAMPDNDPRARNSYIDLADFSNDNFILLHKGKSLRTVTDYYFKQAGIVPNILLESDSPHTIREFIKAGIGISLVPEITWSEVNGDRISLVPINSPSCTRYICMSWTNIYYLSEPAKKFRDYMIKNFKNTAVAYAKENGYVERG